MKCLTGLIVFIMLALGVLTPAPLTAQENNLEIIFEVTVPDDLTELLETRRPIPVTMTLEYIPAEEADFEGVQEIELELSVLDGFTFVENATFNTTRDGLQATSILLRLAPNESRTFSVELEVLPDAVGLYVLEINGTVNGIPSDELAYRQALEIGEFSRPSDGLTITAEQSDLLNDPDDVAEVILLIEAKQDGEYTLDISTFAGLQFINGVTAQSQTLSMRAGEIREVRIAVTPSPEALPGRYSVYAHATGPGFDQTRIGQVVYGNYIIEAVNADNGVYVAGRATPETISLSEVTTGEALIWIENTSNVPELHEFSLTIAQPSRRLGLSADNLPPFLEQVSEGAELNITGIRLGPGEGYFFPITYTINDETGIGRVVIQVEAVNQSTNDVSNQSGFYLEVLE